MAKMSLEVQKAVERFKPGLIATASGSGKPNVSPKGSLQVLDDEHVVFVDIKSPGTLANLKECASISPPEAVAAFPARPRSSIVVRCSIR